MQALFLLIINSLEIKPLAIPLANSATYHATRCRYPLRIQWFCKRFIDSNLLVFNQLACNRLRFRLQKHQLSPSTRLQVPVVSFAACKEKLIDNQAIAKNLFAGLFAKN
jgi:hypothetical protein